MLTTTCKGCGLTLAGEDEDQLVSAVSAHLAAVHPGGHAPTREQVLSVIRSRGRHEP